MKGNKLIDDHVQISVNLARLKSHGKQFEIVIDPDKVVAYKQGENVDVDELVQAQEIFSDAKKGLLSQEGELQDVFGSTDALEIIKQIIDKGEIQFTHAYRQDLREQKYNKVVHLIHRNAMNPKTKLPHPENRIRSAMEEAKIRLNDFKKAEDQLDEVVDKLRPIMPITLAKVTIAVHLPASSAARAQGTLRKYGKVLKEIWGNDGSLSAHVQLPAGLQEECIAELQSVTHGGADIKLNE